MFKLILCWHTRTAVKADQGQGFLTQRDEDMALISEGHQQTDKSNISNISLPAVRGYQIDASKKANKGKPLDKTKVTTHTKKPGNIREERTSIGKEKVKMDQRVQRAKEGTYQKRTLGIHTMLSKTLYSESKDTDPDCSIMMKNDKASQLKSSTKPKKSVRAKEHNTVKSVKRNVLQKHEQGKLIWTNLEEGNDENRPGQQMSRSTNIQTDKTEYLDKSSVKDEKTNISDIEPKQDKKTQSGERKIDSDEEASKDGRMETKSGHVHLNHSDAERDNQMSPETLQKGIYNDDSKETPRGNLTAALAGSETLQAVDSRVNEEQRGQNSTDDSKSFQGIPNDETRIEGAMEDNLMRTDLLAVIMSEEGPKEHKETDDKEVMFEENPSPHLKENSRVTNHEHKISSLDESNTQSKSVKSEDVGGRHGAELGTGHDKNENEATEPGNEILQLILGTSHDNNKPSTPDVGEGSMNSGDKLGSGTDKSEDILEEGNGTCTSVNHGNKLLERSSDSKVEVNKDIQSEDSKVEEENNLIGTSSMIPGKNEGEEESNKEIAESGNDITNIILNGPSGPNDQITSDTTEKSVPRPESNKQTIMVGKDKASIKSSNDSTLNDITKVEFEKSDEDDAVLASSETWNLGKDLLGLILAEHNVSDVANKSEKPSNIQECDICQNNDSSLSSSTTVNDKDQDKPSGTQENKNAIDLGNDMMNLVLFGTIESNDHSACESKDESISKQGEVIQQSQESSDQGKNVLKQSQTTHGSDSNEASAKSLGLDGGPESGSNLVGFILSETRLHEEQLEDTQIETTSNEDHSTLSKNIESRDDQKTENTLRMTDVSANPEQGGGRQDLESLTCISPIISHGEKDANSEVVKSQGHFDDKSEVIQKDHQSDLLALILNEQDRLNTQNENENQDSNEEKKENIPGDKLDQGEKKEEVDIGKKSSSASATDILNSVSEIAPKTLEDKDTVSQSSDGRDEGIETLDDSESKESIAKESTVKPEKQIAEQVSNKLPDEDMENTVSNPLSSPPVSKYHEKEPDYPRPRDPMFTDKQAQMESAPVRRSTNGENIGAVIIMESSQEELRKRRLKLLRRQSTLKKRRGTLKNRKSGTFDADSRATSDGNPEVGLSRRNSVASDFDPDDPDCDSASRVVFIGSCAEWSTDDEMGFDSDTWDEELAAVTEKDIEENDEAGTGRITKPYSESKSQDGTPKAKIDVTYPLNVEMGPEDGDSGLGTTVGNIKGIENDVGCRVDKSFVKDIVSNIINTSIHNLCQEECLK